MTGEKAPNLGVLQVSQKNLLENNKDRVSW
jgi:hypothetical protein